MTILEVLALIALMVVVGIFYYVLRFGFGCLIARFGALIRKVRG